MENTHIRGTKNTHSPETEEKNHGQAILNEHSQSAHPCLGEAAGGLPGFQQPRVAAAKSCHKPTPQLHTMEGMDCTNKRSF